MSSSSLLLIDDLNSDHQNGDGQSIAPINLTRRVSRLYRLYDRIIFRKRWAKLAKKLIVKFEIRVANKLHKLNCGYATLISNRKKMIFERWKRRFYFIKLSRKLVHNYRIFEITESLNDLKSEYSEHYRQIWGNWSKILLKENKKVQIIQTLHNKNLLAKYFIIWEDNFEFYYYELRELQNKWRSLAYGILARETISNARQIKWQFICDKLRVKKMKDYYTKERFRKIWIHLTKRIYAKDKSEKFLLGRRTIELNKKWLFMVKGMRNIEFSKAFERSKLPSLFKKYICLRKTHKLNHLSEKLIATKKLFHDQMITKKYFSVWFKRFNLIINSKLIANITQNFAIDTYMQSIANSSARTIQKLCRFYLMKKTFRQNLRMWKFFEIWHFKTFIFPELYPKIRVPKLTMNIQFHISFDFPFVYYAPRFDFIRNVFDYKQILKLDRANKISKKAINQINVSTGVLGVEQIIASLGIYDFIRPQYHPDYSKRKISFHPDFDFKKPLIYISKEACPIPVSKRTSPKKDIPKKKVKTTVIKKFRFRLLLKYQNLDVFSNFHYQNSLFSRINQNLVYDNLLSFESPKLNVESIINYNFISMPSQRLLFSHYYEMHLEKLNFSEYQQYIFDKFSLNFNFGYQKRVERRSMLCSRRIRPRLFFKDINVNRKTFQFLWNFSSTLNPIFNNLPVKFTNLTIPTEIASSLKRRKNAHIPEKIDYGIKRKNTQINNTAKILLNNNFQFKYSFVNFSTFSNYKKHFVAERNINIIPQFDFNKPLLFLSKSKPRCCQKLTKIVHNVDDDLYIPYLDNWKYIIQYISDSSLSFSMVATFSKSIFIDALIPNKEINQPSKIKPYHQVTPTIKNQFINFYLYEMDLKIHQFDVCVNSIIISNLVHIYQSPKPRILLPSNIMTNINLHVPFFEQKKLSYIRNTIPDYKIPQIQMNLTFDFFQNIIYKSCTFIQNHVYYSTFMNKKDLHIFFNANPIEIYNYSPEICIKGFMNYQMSVRKSHEKVVNFNLLHDIINFNFNQIDLNLQVEYLKNLSPINKINKCGNVKFTKYRSPTLHLEIPIMRSLKSRTFQLNTYYYEKSDIIQNKELINNFIYDISINMNKNIFFGHQPDCFLNNYQKDASEIKLELKYDIDFEFNNLINNFLLIQKLDSLNDSREIITSTEKNINNVKNRNSNISETTMFHLISHKINLIPFLPDINTNILQNYSCIKVIPKVESTFLSNISINFFSYLQSTVEIYRNHVIPFKRYFYLHLKNDDDVDDYDVLNDIQMIDVNYQFLDQLPNILFLKSFFKPPQNHNIDELITFQYVSDVSLINSISSFQSIVNQKLLKMQAYVQKNLSGTDSDYDARFIENKEAGLNNFSTTSLIKPIQGMLMNKFYHRVSLFENIELNGFILQKEINNSMSNQMNLFHLFNEILSLEVNNFDLLEIGNFTMKLNFLVNNFDGIKHKTQIKTDDIHIFIPPLNFNDIVGSLNINQLSRYYKSCILDFENHEKFEFSLEKINIQSLNIAPLKYLKMKDISNFAISLLFDNIDLFAKFREYATIDFDFPLLSTLLFDSTDESETCISKLLDDSLACMLRNIAVDIDLIPNYLQENQSTIHKTMCSVDEIINKSLTKSLIDGLKFESIFSNAIINYYSPFVDYDVHIYIDIVELETNIKSLLHYSQIFLSEKRNIVIHNHFSCFEEIIKIDEKLTNPESYIQYMQNYKAANFPFNHTFNMDKSFSFPSINEAAMTLSEILINMLYQINNMEFQNYFVSEKKIVLQKSLQLFENDFINILQGRFIGTLYSTIDLYSSQSSTIDFPQFQPKEREQTNINQFSLSIPYRFPQKRYSNFIEDTLHSLFRTTLQNSQELSLFVTSYYISTDEDDEEKAINIVDNERDFLLENAEGIFQESLQTSFSYPGLPSLQLFDHSEEEMAISFAVDSISLQFSFSLNFIFDQSLLIDSYSIEESLFYDHSSVPILVNDLIFEDFLNIDSIFFADLSAYITTSERSFLNHILFNFQTKCHQDNRNMSHSSYQFPENPYLDIVEEIIRSLFSQLHYYNIPIKAERKAETVKKYNISQYIKQSLLDNSEEIIQQSLLASFSYPTLHISDINDYSKEIVERTLSIVIDDLSNQFTSALNSSFNQVILSDSKDITSAIFYDHNFVPILIDDLIFEDFLDIDSIFHSYLTVYIENTINSILYTSLFNLKRKWHRNNETRNKLPRKTLDKSIPYRFPQKRYSNFIEDTLHSLFRTTLQNSQELSLFVTSYYISTDEDDEEKAINIVDNERDFLLENAEGIFQESLQTSFSYPGLPSLQLFDFYCSSNEISEEILFAVIDSLSSQLSVSLENSLMASYNANIGDIFNYLFNDNVKVQNGVSECMPIIESTISNALLNALFYTKRPSVEPIFEIRQIWSTQSVNSDYMLDNLNFSVSFSLDNLYKNDSYKWLDNYQMSFVMEFSHNQNQLFDLTFEYNRLFEPQLSTLMIFQISSHFFSENNFQESKIMSQNVCESFENNIIPNNILNYLVFYISKQFCEFDLLDNLYQQKLIEKPYLTIQLRKTLSTLFRLKTVLLPVYIPQNIHFKLLLFDQKCYYLSYIQSGILYKIFIMNYRDDSYVRRYIIPRTVKMIENDFQNVLQYCLHSVLHSPEISFDLPSLHNPPPKMVQIEPYQFPQKRCNNFLNKALTGILMSAIIHPQDLSLINSFDFIKSEGEGSKIYSEKLIFPGNTNTEKHLINENFYHHETEQIILNCLQTSFSISPFSSMNIFIEDQVINLDERNAITTLPLDKEDPPSRYIDIHFFTDDFSNTLNSTLRNSLFSSLQLSCITAANSLLGLDYEEPDQEMSVITDDYDLTNIYDCNVFYFMNDPAHKMISDFHCTRILYEFSSYQNSRSVSLVDILQQEKFQFISPVYKFVSPLCHLKLYNFPIKRLQTYLSTINLNTSFILLSSVITNVNNSVRRYQKINLPPIKIDCNPCHKFDFPSTTEATLNLSENSANILYQIMTLEFQNNFVSEKKIVLQKSLQLFENDFINILQGRFIGTLYSTIDLYSSQSSTIDFPQFQPKEREQTNINQFSLSIPYRFPQKRYSNFIEDTLHSLFRTTLQNSQELSLFVTSYYISTDEDDEEHKFTISKRINKFLLENTEQIILESFQSSLISFDLYYCSKDLTEETIFFVMNSITSQFSSSLTSVFETSLFLNTSQIEDGLFYDINSIPIYVNDLIFEDFLDINTLFYSDFYASIKKETFLNLNNSIFNFQRKNNREDNLSLRYPYPSVNEAVVSLSDHSIVGFSFINNLIYHQTNEKKKILHHAIKYLLYEVDDIISSTFLKSVINSSINAATESYNLILYHRLPQKKLYEMPMIIYNQLDEIITESLLNSVNNDFFICLTGNFDQDFHEFDSTHKIHKTEFDQQIFEHKFKRINRCLKEMIDENINHALNHHFPTFDLFIHDQSEPSD